jgi:uncharacterized protein YbbK (DUF523 family)
MWLSGTFFQSGMVSYTPRLGVSACLTGEPVRYDGGHKHHALINQHLLPQCHVTAYCPEVASGMGIPRPTIRLVQTKPNTIEVFCPGSPSINPTRKLKQSSNSFCNSNPDLDGIVLKARSPSCGLESAPVFDSTGIELGTSSGIFAYTSEKQLPEAVLQQETYFENAEYCISYLFVLFLAREQRFQNAEPTHTRNNKDYFNFYANRLGEASTNLILEKKWQTLLLEQTVLHYANEQFASEW